MMIDKPAEISGRDREWAALTDFSQSSRAGAVGLVYGRRRVGKSFLLRRLADACDGLYFQATEVDRAGALSAFGRAVAQFSNEPDVEPDTIAFRDWEDALRRRTGLVVIDEFPYLLAHSPELPSLLQRIVDDAANGARPPIRIVLCGSSLSVMTKLLSGQQPLRGRATLDMHLRAFDHVAARGLWSVTDLELAIRLDAIFGGAPGYRALTDGLPQSSQDLGEWLARNVLSSSHALYREDDYLLREDPRISDRSLYASLLSAIASGVTTQTELAGRLRRSRESLQHPLDLLIGAGFVIRSDDLLSDRKPIHTLADPILRFIRLVVEPDRPLLDEGRWAQVWRRAGHRLDSQIHGPHLEAVARRWASSIEPSSGSIDAVGQATLADAKTRRSVQVDVLALGVDDSGRKAVHLIGEAKWSASGFDAETQQRLERARQLLAGLGFEVGATRQAWICREPVATPPGVEAVGLEQLYEAPPN